MERAGVLCHEGTTVRRGRKFQYSVLRVRTPGPNNNDGQPVVLRTRCPTSTTPDFIHAEDVLINTLPRCNTSVISRRTPPENLNPSRQQASDQAPGFVAKSVGALRSTKYQHPSLPTPPRNHPTIFLFRFRTTHSITTQV